MRERKEEGDIHERRRYIHLDIEKEEEKGKTRERREENKKKYERKIIDELKETE